MSPSSVAFDILMVTDCRFPGGNTSSVVEEIRAQHRAGYRTGILHLPSTVLGAARPFADKIREVLDEGLAELVLGAGHIEADLLLARHPTVFTDPPAGLPRIDARHVLLAVNQVPFDARGEAPYYDVAHVQQQIRAVTGAEATWAPIGPRIRQELESYRDTVSLLEWDWENVIDVTQWTVQRDGFCTDRPVIGRHSRGHWTKWPDNAEELRAAYPDDPRYLVRVLGGAATPAKILGGLPANWADYPFNSLPAQDFLAGIDFFVYFHHPGLVEAFGRVVLEALAAGAVAIVPGYLEPLFGDGCLYGTPADVRGYVDALWADPAAFARRSAAGVELAHRRFSYATHNRRLAALIGEPATQPRTQPSQAPATPPRRSGGTVIADLTGLGETAGQASDGPARGGQDSGGKLLSAIVEHAAARGPCSAAIPAEQASEPSGAALAELAAVETFPRVLAGLAPAHRRGYLTDRLAELLRSHRPRTLIVLEEGDTAGAKLPDPSPGTEILRVRPEPGAPEAAGPPEPAAPQPGPSEPGSPEADTALAESLAGVLPQGWAVHRHEPASRRTGGTPGGTTGGTPGGDAPQRRGFAARLFPWLRLGALSLPPWLRLRTRLRRKLRTRRRARLARLLDEADDLGVLLFEAGEGPPRLPVPATVTHRAPERLPLGLVVISGQHPAAEAADPDAASAGTDPSAEAGVRALVERQQVTSGFRLALLAPPSWERAAAAYGVTIETLIPEPVWRAQYGGGWPGYLRARVAWACRVLQPETVAYAGRGEAADPVVGEVLEAARVRPRMDPRASPPASHPAGPPGGPGRAQPAERSEER